MWGCRRAAAGGGRHARACRRVSEGAGVEPGGRARTAVEAVQVGRRITALDRVTLRHPAPCASNGGACASRACTLRWRRCATRGGPRGCARGRATACAADWAAARRLRLRGKLCGGRSCCAACAACEDFLHLFYSISGLKARSPELDSVGAPIVDSMFRANEQGEPPKL